MAFVTIAGTTVRMTDFTRLPDETGGKRQRTLSGKRRGDILWTARSWQGRALCLTDAEADALRVLTDDTTPRLCAGDGFPTGGVTCHVEAGTDAYDRVRNPTASSSVWWRTPALTFREVL